MAGIVRPSVTQTLKLGGVRGTTAWSPPGVLENARRRGTNVHLLTAEFDRYGEIDEDVVAGGRDCILRGMAKVPPANRSSSFTKSSSPCCAQLWAWRSAARQIGSASSVATGSLSTSSAARAKHAGWGLQTADYEMMLTGKPRVGHLGEDDRATPPHRKLQLFRVRGTQADAPAAIAALTLATTQDRFRSRGRNAYPQRLEEQSRTENRSVIGGKKYVSSNRNRTHPCHQQPYHCPSGMMRIAFTLSIKFPSHEVFPYGQGVPIREFQ